MPLRLPPPVTVTTSVVMGVAVACVLPAPVIHAALLILNLDCLVSPSPVTSNTFFLVVSDAPLPTTNSELVLGSLNVPMTTWLPLVDIKLLPPNATELLPNTVL